MTLCVPFVNRPFESEIHGTVNFTQFCCVLLVTWCYRVLLSCYLRPKYGMQRSRAWCGTPPILGVVNMVGTRNFTCYMGAL